MLRLILGIAVIIVIIALVYWILTGTALL
jgi:hypothetical protein